MQAIKCYYRCEVEIEYYPWFLLDKKLEIFVCFGIRFSRFCFAWNMLSNSCSIPYVSSSLWLNSSYRSTKIFEFWLD